MLTEENFTKEHIRDLQSQSRADPSILERTVFAFGLLQAISLTGMPFIFKGGTSLLLILKVPHRLSTDIDIIVEPGTDIDHCIDEAAKIFPFRRAEEDIRKGPNNIEKRHFRFLFDSPLTEDEINILLDVVFEEAPYETVQQRPLKSNILLTEGEDLLVRTPDAESILGEKLTAFAPHTTGIPFGVGKELEVIKQFYDCNALIGELQDYAEVAGSYVRAVGIELGYRGLDLSAEDVLMDTIRSSLCLLGRGAVHPEDYSYLARGIGAINGHFITGTLNGENAAVLSCRVMHIAACLLAGEEYRPITEAESYLNEKIDLKGSRKIAYVRNVDLDAYAHLIESLRILESRGMLSDALLS
jgi:hypothetical protein